MGLERFQVEKAQFWSCSKSAENWAASSLWIGGQAYTSILYASKLGWVQSNLKLDHDFGRLSKKNDMKSNSFKGKIDLSSFFQAQKLTNIKNFPW